MAKSATWHSGHALIRWVHARGCAGLILSWSNAQRMMAWLLFVEPAEVPRLQALQLGLGAAR